ncbi:hypothetical protein BJ508DRAFT_323980 [Ascobolus immersus RN42]|uniref:CCHC-type domain-containing protein n=1 Tax=Ascobolus immersus RN42 TaxID=1160509 RepID=A0A3N4IEW1_ASCIM|nr:hypothetical protein BJ508DRAFT_323980 [Ascobolus immersus RN42]
MGFESVEWGVYIGTREESQGWGFVEASDTRRITQPKHHLVTPLLHSSTTETATLENPTNERRASLIREISRLQQVAARGITLFVQEARTTIHPELKLRTEDILRGREPLQIVSELEADELEQRVEFELAGITKALENLECRTPVPTNEDFNDLISQLADIRKAITESARELSPIKSSEEGSFHSLDSEDEIGEETVIPDPSRSTKIFPEGDPWGPNHPFTPFDFWKSDEDSTREEFEQSSTFDSDDEPLGDWIGDLDQGDYERLQAEWNAQNTSQQSISTQSTTETEPETSNVFTMSTATDIVSRMQAKASEDLEFFGYYEEEGEDKPAVTEEMKSMAAEDFESYMDAVGFAATFLMPPSNTSSPELVERSRKVAFELGLKGEARAFFATLDARTRRDYKAVVTKFRLRYIGGLDALEEKSKRKEALLKFQSSCSQGSKSLMRYLAEGMFYYERVDPRYKWSSGTTDSEWDLEEGFVDGLTDVGLADTLRGRLASQGKTTFAIKDILDNVKYLRRRAWSNEEYTRHYNQLRDSELGIEKPKEPMDNALLARAIDKLADKVEKVGSQNGSSAGSVAPPSYASNSNRQPLGQSTYNKQWPMRGNCYSCGQVGHTSNLCTNPNKLSREESLKLINRDRDLRAARESAQAN